MNISDIPFLIRDIKNEMPLHTDNKTTIPYSFKSLPKKVMEESHKVDNKFLNNHLGEIEEAVHKKLIDKTSFINQQVKYHGKSGILNHDNFFHCDLATGTPISSDNFHHSNFVIDPYMVSPSCTKGDNLETFSTGGDWGNRGDNAIEMMRTADTDGVIDECYDQIALQSNQSSGNIYMGVYDDNGSTVPNDLYTQTGSLSIETGYAFKSLTEFELTTVKTWFAYVKDAAGQFNENNTVTFTHFVKSPYSYAALPDPAQTSGSYGSIIQMKIGHS